MTSGERTHRCFFERDPTHSLARRAGVEAVGTLMLMFAAGASANVIAQSGQHDASSLLLHAVATSAALAALITAFGPVSGGHFNPIITIGQLASGERSVRCTVAYVIGQSFGAIAGAMLLPAFEPPRSADAHSPTWALTASELVATAALMIVVFGSSRGGRAQTGPFAVGAWLAGLIIYMPSTYANPALVLGAMGTTGPMAIGIDAALLFIPAQMVGGLLALVVILLGYGATPRQAPGQPLP